jgi:membrane associated rhomboid family serine protease
MFDYRLGNWEFQPFSVNPMIGPDSGVLVRSGAKVECLILAPYSEWYRFLTPMWLHAGILHLLSNMNCVYQTGFSLEREFGWKRIGPLYLFGGIYGTMCSLVFLPDSLMVGASGAAFALLGACWVYAFYKLHF